jgi:hypothetical protein
MSPWIGKGSSAHIFFLFCTARAYWRNKSSCVIRRCAATRKKIREIKFENYRRCKFGPHYLLAQGCIVASINWRSASMPVLSSSADLFHSPWWQQFTVFCLFVRTLPIDFALLGRKRKYIKIKTTAKLKAKRTSIPTIWYLCRTYGTFPTPLGSHYRLPLKPESFPELCTVGSSCSLIYMDRKVMPLFVSVFPHIVSEP